MDEINKRKYLFVGAGLANAVIANYLTSIGAECVVIDKRNHIGGNCYTTSSEEGIIVHEYGPHIFHTNDSEVWEYISQYVEMEPFVNRVKANTGEEILSMPINLHTINQLYGKTFSPEEAKKFLTEVSENIPDPQNFEEQALSMVGEKIYRKLFYGYTKKQWGCEPRDLPASILKRLPVRFDYNDNYFNDQFQGLPMNGYTELFQKLFLNIEVRLDTVYEKSMSMDFDHTFFSGPLDEYFNFSEGKLNYRSLRFERIETEGDFQGCAVLNFNSEFVPYTRVTEHKHFMTKRNFTNTIVFKEYSENYTGQNEPYYPTSLGEDKIKLGKYYDLIRNTSKITFLGRLGTYRYLDMHVIIRESLDLISEFKRSRKFPQIINDVYTL